MPVDKIPIIQNWNVERAPHKRLRITLDVENGRVQREYYLPEYRAVHFIANLCDETPGCGPEVRVK